MVPRLKDNNPLERAPWKLQNFKTDHIYYYPAFDRNLEI